MILPIFFPKSRTQARLFSVQVVASLRTIQTNVEELLELVGREAAQDSAIRSAPDSIQYLQYCRSLIIAAENFSSALVDELIKKHSRLQPVPQLHQSIIIIAQLSTKKGSKELFEEIIITLAESLLPENEAKRLLKEIGSVESSPIGLHTF